MQFLGSKVKTYDNSTFLFGIIYIYIYIYVPTPWVEHSSRGILPAATSDETQLLFSIIDHSIYVKRDTWKFLHLHREWRGLWGKISDWRKVRVSISAWSILRVWYNETVCVWQYICSPYLSVEHSSWETCWMPHTLKCNSSSLELSTPGTR